MNRREKISLLKDVIRGRKQAGELPPNPITGFFVLYMNTYLDMRTGKEYTIDEFRKLKEK